MRKSIKRGIKDIKKGKTTKVTTVDVMFKEMEEEKRKHPVRSWLRPKFWQVVRLPGDIRRAINAFLQRGQRGYADSDVWGLWCYLSDVISKSVYHLKKHNHGYPSGLTEGQWIDILNEIRDTFDTAKAIANDRLYLIKNKTDRKKWEKVIDNLNKKYKDNERCMTDKEIKQYERGWKLFQQYFFNLWD